MASDSIGKRPKIFNKMLNKAKGDSSSKKTRKNVKKKELKLEVASVWENFDPETYIIPLQNKWTFESNEQKKINKLLELKDNSTVVTAEQSNFFLLESSSTIEKENILSNMQNPSSTRVSKNAASKEMISRKGSAKLMDDLDETGYVPSHPRFKQRLKATKDFHSSTPTWSKLLYKDDMDENISYHDITYINPETTKFNHPAILNERFDNIPGFIENNQDYDFDGDSELDIDTVELIAETDDEDRWSTPSLPALSVSASEESSDESSDENFDKPAQTALSNPIMKTPIFSPKNFEVLDQNDESQHSLTSKINSPESAFNALEEQRQFILKNMKISERRDKKLKKQRAKDIKLMNQRFSRLESHVITLARSMAHLSSELRSQKKFCKTFADLQKEVHDLIRKRDNEIGYLQERICQMQADRISQKKLRKLRNFFGEDPGHPLLCNFLESIGYQEYSPYFQMAKIGLMELPYLNEDQLRDIGIPTGPRTRILENVKYLHQ